MSYWSQIEKELTLKEMIAESKAAKLSESCEEYSWEVYHEE